jgi:HEAT repeat protein
MQHLAHILQDESQTMGTRARVLSALILSNDPNLSALFQHLIDSQKISVRKLAALGLGTQSSTQATNSLSNLFQDYPEVSNVACLALVNIGTQPAMDAISNALLQGSEDLQKAAAEALANHPTEGHPILQAGAELEDLLVQRAVIYGLRRIHQPWTLALLEKIQIEEGQWVVKNAAAQAFEEMKLPDSRIPHVLPSLADTPWLISFAAHRDLGIRPGKPGLKLLLRVLKEGTSAEQLAAMQQFQRHGNILYGNDPDLSAAAYITLWTLAATGVDLPHPLKFGFR